MSNALMATRKNKRSEVSRAITQAIIDQYQPVSAEDMQDVASYKNSTTQHGGLEHFHYYLCR